MPGGVAGLIVAQDLLKKTAAVFIGLFFLLLFYRKQFRLSPLFLQRWLFRPPPRGETSTFFDTGFRQLRQFQIYANAVPDPQVFST